MPSCVWNSRRLTISGKDRRMKPRRPDGSSRSICGEANDIDPAGRMAGGWFGLMPGSRPEAPFPGSVIEVESRVAPREYRRRRSRDLCFGWRSGVQETAPSESFCTGFCGVCPGKDAVHCPCSFEIDRARTSRERCVISRVSGPFPSDCEAGGGGFETVLQGPLDA